MNIKLAGLVILAAIFRFWGVTTEGAWLDETIAFQHASLGFGQMLSVLAIDVHPPLYFIILRQIIDVAGYNLLAARSLSVLLSVLTVIVFFLLARRLTNEKTAVLAGLILALSSTHIYFAQEVRMYALLSFFAVTAAYALVRYLQESKKVWLFVYVISLLAAAYTHNFALFLILAHALFLLHHYRNTKRLLLPFLLVGIGAGLAYLPWAIVAARQTLQWNANFWLSDVHTAGTALLPFFFSGGILLGTVLGLLAIKEARAKKPYDSLLLLWLVVPPVIALLISVLVVPITANKYLLYSSFPLYLLAARHIMSLKGALRTGLIIAIVLASIAQAGLQVYTQEKEPWSDVLQYEKPLFVSPPYLNHLVAFYLHPECMGKSLEECIPPETLAAREQDANTVIQTGFFGNALSIEQREDADELYTTSPPGLAELGVLWSLGEEDIAASTLAVARHNRNT